MDPGFPRTSSTMGYSVDNLKFLHLPPEILYEILNFLDPSTILKCRLVNSTWTTLSNKSIHQIQGQDDYFKLHFVRNCHLKYPDLECFTLKKKPRTKKILPKKTLTDLINFLQPPETKLDFLRLPFQNFEFTDKDFESSEFEQFTQSIGEEIQGLNLEFEYVEPESSFLIRRDLMLKNLLTKQVPNIQSLSLYLSENWQFIANHTDFATHDSNNEQQLILPHLKKFRIDMEHWHVLLPIVGTILKAAVNLNSFSHNFWNYYNHNFSVYYPTLLTLDKICCVKLVQFIPRPTSDWLDLYEKVAWNKPGFCNLENIVIDSCLDLNDAPPGMIVSLPVGQKLCTRVFKLLIKILECCALKLQKMTILEMAQSAQFLPPGFSAHFPSFPNLRILILNRNSRQRQTPYPPLSCSIPPPLEWNRIFPRLTTLCLTLSRMEGGEKEWTKFFENFPPIKSVKELDLDLQERIDPGSAFFETLSRVFCEVKCLTFSVWRRPITVVTHIWKYFGSIQKLHLVLILYGGTASDPITSREENDYFLNFDPFFTGFSKKDCDTLKEGWMGAVDKEKFVEETRGKMEEFKRGPSILDLKELRDLIIEFDIYAGIKNSGPYRPLSPVTGEFAFRLMENKLNVHLLMEKQYSEVMRENVRAGMEEMKPYADVRLVRMDNSINI